MPKLWDAPELAASESGRTSNNGASTINDPGRNRAGVVSVVSVIVVIVDVVIIIVGDDDVVVFFLPLKNREPSVLGGATVPRKYKVQAGGKYGTTKKK